MSPSIPATNTDRLPAVDSRAMPLLRRSTSTSSIHSTLSFLSDTSSTSPTQPAATHSVWLSSTSPYRRVLLLLLTLSFTFTFGFCVSSRLSCAMGHFVIGKIKPGAEPRALALIATCVTILVPANFIAAFIFHFAKAQPGAEESECDLTRPSGWLQLGKQIASAAVQFVTQCCCRRDKASHQAAGSINGAPDTPPSSPPLSLLSIPRSFLFLSTALLSFLFTAHTPIGLWLRNGFLDTVSILLTLFPSYLHNAFDVQGWYSVAVQHFMERVFGGMWVTVVGWGVMIANTTRTVVLLPVWYRNVPWREQISIDGTPLPHWTHDARCDLRSQEQLEEVGEDKRQSGEAGCETTSYQASLSASPVQLPQSTQLFVRCSSTAETASPDESPRSVLSDDFDSASVSSEDWQLDEMAQQQLDNSTNLHSLPSSSSFSSSTTSVELPATGRRSVIWLFLLMTGVMWYSFLFLSIGLFNSTILQPVPVYLASITAWTNTHPTIILCLCFGVLLFFLITDHVRHFRHSHHQQHAFTAEGCDCRTPYLLLLCALISLDSIYYFVITPFSSIISQSYLALDSSLHQRALTVLTFYGLMLIWQLIVRYVAMHALPRGSSLAVLFPLQLIEDVWADLIFTSFTPFSWSFFVISFLHVSKTFIRDFDLLPSILLYLPTLFASTSSASVRACLTQSNSWRLAFPRRVLRHQNLVTELCAKVVVVAVLCGDMVGEGVLGPPMMLIDPTVPFNGVYWDEQKRQRGMIVAALVFLMFQQCVVHAVVLRLLGRIDGMAQEDKMQAEKDETAADDCAETQPAEESFLSMEEAAEEAPHDSCDVERAECDPLDFALPSSCDDECHVPYQSADNTHSPSYSTPPLLRSTTSTPPSPPYPSDGIIWLDRHWRFHFLFFMCCIVRLITVVLSIISENLHSVYYDNRLMCTYIRWMSGIGYQGNV